MSRDSFACGHAEIGGHRYPLERLWLADGKINFAFLVPGRDTPLEGQASFFAPDGSRVVTGTRIYHLFRLPSWDSYTVRYALSIETVWPHPDSLELEVTR